MATKIRKQIYIEPEQEKVLKSLVRRTGFSEAEIIRRAIDQQAKVLQLPRFKENVWSAESAYIRALMKSPPVAGGRSWRREELHER